MALLLFSKSSYICGQLSGEMRVRMQIEVLRHKKYTSNCKGGVFFFFLGLVEIHSDLYSYRL